MDKSWLKIAHRTKDKRYKLGVEEFLKFAYRHKEESEKIPCPCKSCNNFYLYDRDIVFFHLMHKGICMNYDKWTYHGEEYEDVSNDEYVTTNEVEGDEEGYGDSHEQSEGTTSNQQDLMANTPFGNTSLVTSTSRGPSRNLNGKRKGCSDEKLVIEVNENAGRFVGSDSQQVITKGGCIVRQFAKFDGTTWKHQPQELKDEIIAKCTENSNYDGSDLVKKAFHTQFSAQHRNRQYRLHLNFKKFPSKEEAMRHLPTSVKKDEWAKLCERFASEDFQEISHRNKGNRAANDTSLAVGSVSIARIVHDLTKKEGKASTAINQYEICHYSKKKGKMVSDKAQRTLAELRHQESTSSSLLTDICKNKLHHIPGHVKEQAVSKRSAIAVERLRNEVEVERRRADDTVEQNAAIIAKVAAQEAELNAMKKQMQFLMAEITRLASQQSEKD